MNGIQEVDGSIPFSSTLFSLPVTRHRQPLDRGFWRLALRLVMLAIALPGGFGCTASDRRRSDDEFVAPAPISRPAQPPSEVGDRTGERTTSIERPAQPLSEEQSLSDNAGEVGVVLLVVGVALGGILLPLLLLF